MWETPTETAPRAFVNVRGTASATALNVTRVCGGVRAVPPRMGVACSGCVG
jgi:hypothetical protein